MSDAENLDLMTKLKVLSSIKENQRVCTRAVDVRVDDRGTFQGLFRMWDGENRRHNIETIKCIVHQAIDVMEVNSRITSELMAAIKGIENLKRTYGDDSHAVARLQVIIDMANVAINGTCGFVTGSLTKKKKKVS